MPAPPPARLSAGYPPLSATRTPTESHRLTVDPAHAARRARLATRAKSVATSTKPVAELTKSAAGSAEGSAAFTASLARAATAPAPLAESAAPAAKPVAPLAEAPARPAESPARPTEALALPANAATRPPRAPATPTESGDIRPVGGTATGAGAPQAPIHQARVVRADIADAGATRGSGRWAGALLGLRRGARKVFARGNVTRRGDSS